MTFFRCPQESPSHKSVLLSSTQQQEHLDVTVHLFTFLGLGGTDLSMTKEPALHVESPVSKGTQDSEGAQVADHLVNESLSHTKSS